MILERRSTQLPLTIALLTYNRSNGYLEQTIEGILKQSFTDFELLILDNGSTDSTPQVILALDDPRIRYVRNSPNSPVEFNYASAYQIARGKRIIVTHDDDIMERDMIETQMRCMDEHPEVIMIWTNVSTIDQNGKVITTPVERQDQLFKPGEYFLNFLYERLWPIPSTVMLDRRYSFRGLVKLHYFNDKVVRKKIMGKNVEGAEDVLFLARANIKHSIAYIGKPLLKYRLHPTQGTNGVDLSSPSIFLYQKLKSFIKKSKLVTDFGPLFDSYISRYQIQRKLTLIETSKIHPSTKKYFSSEYKKAEVLTRKLTDAFYPILPLYILIKLIGINDETTVDLKKIPAPNKKQTTATKCLFKWAQLLHDEQSIFTVKEQKLNIAILGSALISSLLILECQNKGINIVCCLESNLNRQNSCLLGISVLPINWLASNHEKVDLLILSSEKDQEVYLGTVIQKLTNNKVTVISWKQLVKNKFDARLLENINE